MKKGIFQIPVLGSQKISVYPIIQVPKSSLVLGLISPQDSDVIQLCYSLWRAFHGARGAAVFLKNKWHQNISAMPRNHHSTQEAAFKPRTAYLGPETVILNLFHIFIKTSILYNAFQEPIQLNWHFWLPFYPISSISFPTIIHFSTSLSTSAKAENPTKTKEHNVIRQTEPVSKHRIHAKST